MADKSKKPAPNKPKFSAWWIYTAIILVFLALNIFSSGSDHGNPKEILQDQLISVIKDGDVKRIDISTTPSKRVAYIYLTDDAKNKEKHTKPADNGMNLFSSSGGADYEYRYGTLENFENSLAALKVDNDFKTKNCFSNFTLTIAFYISICKFSFRSKKIQFLKFNKSVFDTKSKFHP